MYKLMTSLRPLILTSLFVAFITTVYATALSGSSIMKTYRLCSECHERTISCHTPRTFNLGLLKKLWIESIHSNLMKEPFKGCPYLDCRRCHPHLERLQQALSVKP